MPRQKVPKPPEKPGYWRLNWETLLAQLAGLLLGALIGIGISRYYYDKASQDLLNKINGVLVAVTTPGIKVEINKNGEVVPIYEGTAKMVLTDIKASIKATVGPPPGGKPEKPKE